MFHTQKKTMNKLLLVIPVFVGLSACSSPTRENINSKDSTFTNVTAGNHQQDYLSAPADTLQAKDSITNIHVDSNTVWVKGKLEPNQHPSVSFEVHDKDSIIATVKPVGDSGNVRIAQVEMPDKSYDGPFGSELRYKTKGNGTYRIILAENQMAGDRWTGEYYLSVSVK